MYNNIDLLMDSPFALGKITISSGGSYYLNDLDYVLPVRRVDMRRLTKDARSISTLESSTNETNCYSLPLSSDTRNGSAMFYDSFFRI